MAIPHRVKVLEVCRVGPPPGSAAETSLPLTFFDVYRFQEPSVQQIFFYRLTESDSTAHFLNSVFPNLKRSLSLALDVFFPLAGTLALDVSTGELEIRCNGRDSVQLTVAESDSDFDSLSQDRPKEVAMLRQLVPELPTSGSELLSAQVTVFPSSGVCVGVSIHRAAADGSSTMQFVKRWASICRLGADDWAESHPVYDRALVPDPHGLKRTFVEQLESNGKKRLEKGCWGVRPGPDLVAATFVLDRSRLERLRQRVAAARPHVNGMKPPQYSAFSLACAHVWVCSERARSRSGEEEVEEEDKKIGAHFKFDSGCRARYHPPIPAEYFGNCIRPCFVRVGRLDLIGKNGIWVACEAIWRVIQGLNEGGDDDDDDDDDNVVRGAVGWIPRLVSIGAAVEERLIWASWSPKIGVYETDFGLGRPKKVEVVSSTTTTTTTEGGRGAMSLIEGRDGAEGFEVGLVLSRLEMENFSSMFEKGFEEI